MKHHLAIVTPLLLSALIALHAANARAPFSWDRVPVYAHVGKASDDFTTEKLDFLAKHFDFITIEKDQASGKHDLFPTLAEITISTKLTV